MARRPRQSRQLQRKAPKREPYDRVLIVCEGEKTEPAYFEELCSHYRLSSANIEVTPADGSDPGSVVKYAKKLQKKEEKQGDQFDRVYCVFDRDEHTNFNAARTQLSGNGFQSACSWPCFEYWLLLHFGYRRDPFVPTGTGTAAQNCASVLRKSYPDYAKGKKGVFESLTERLDAAKDHAARSLCDAHATQEPNPSTEVHLLVDYLLHLKDNREQ